MGKGILTNITWLANLVKMTESLTVKKKPTMRMWKVKKMLVRRSITRLKNRIQALLYEDSRRECNVFKVDELSKEINNFLFRYNKMKWKRLKIIHETKGNNLKSADALVKVTERLWAQVVWQSLGASYPP